MTVEQGRNLLLASVAVAAFAPGVLAQEVFTLEEIVVTAEKRSVSAQDVGITMNAFAGDTLAAMGAANLGDVTQLMPNVELFDEYGSGQPTWIIRGVGLADFNANNTPASAIYVDDIYLTSNAMGGLALYDLERIEVLKGPQGALYGRNTSGGAVRVISARPTLGESGGHARVGYGRFEAKTLEAAVNLPLGDKAAVRLSGQWNKDGKGWQTNLITGKDHGRTDNWSMRGQLLLAPNDRTELLVKVEAARDRSETTLGQAIGIWDETGLDFCGAIYEGRLDNAGCYHYAAFYDPEFRTADLQGDDGRTTLSDPINRVNNKAFTATANLTVDFDGATFTSITGYNDFKFNQRFDYDASQGEFGHQNGRSDIEAYSQELRLASNGDGPLTWLGGLEYASDRFVEDRDFRLKDDLYLKALLGRRANLGYKQKTEMWAAYANAGFAVSETVELTAGLRYTDETKDYEGGGFTGTFGQYTVPIVEGLDASTDLSILSGKLGLNWRPADDVLVYLSASKGFKSGGIFGGFPTDGEANVAPYKPETVYAYEAGVKSELMDSRLRLNAAAFYYDYRNVQGFLSAFSEVSGTVVTLLGNQGDARHVGAEVDFEWLATKNLTLRGGAAVLDAKITDSDATVFTWFGTEEGLADSKRFYAPDVSYNILANYRIDLAGDLALDLQADWNWRGDRAGEARNPFDAATGSLLGSYGLLGARASLSNEAEGWSLSLYGRNLADKTYWANVTTDDLWSWMRLPGAPRTWGVEFSYDW